MAELLVLNRDSTPEQHTYKRGDIVVVMPDGHEWGNSEGLPDFVRVSLPGVAVSDIRDALTMPHEVSAAESAPSAVRAISRLYAEYKRIRSPDRITRRRYCVPSQLMTPDANGYISVTLAQLQDKKHAP